MRGGVLFGMRVWRSPSQRSRRYARWISCVSVGETSECRGRQNVVGAEEKGARRCAGSLRDEGGTIGVPIPDGGTRLSARKQAAMTTNRHVTTGRRQHRRCKAWRLLGAACGPAEMMFRDLSFAAARAAVAKLAQREMACPSWGERGKIASDHTNASPIVVRHGTRHGNWSRHHAARAARRVANTRARAGLNSSTFDGRDDVRALRLAGRVTRQARRGAGEEASSR